VWVTVLVGERVYVGVAGGEVAAGLQLARTTIARLIVKK
jgi:hypothetical protein